MLETRFTGTPERPRLICTYTTNTRKIREAVSTEEMIGTTARLIATAARAPKSLAVKLARAIRKAWREGIGAPAAQPAAAAEPPRQLDVGRVQRPEFFCTANLCGLTVPITVEIDGGGRGQWLAFVQRADGTRESYPLRSPLEDSLGGEARALYLDPIPPAPGANGDPRWSRASREAWLGGGVWGPAAVLVKGMAELFQRQIDFSVPGAPAAEDWARVASCWVALTYVYLVCDTVPYVLVQGAPGSGKTKFLEVLAELVYRPLVTSNVTASALFRALSERGGTMVFDEAEEIGTRGASEVRNILLAGYRKFGKATRVDGMDGARDYHVFGPKAVAAINHPGPVLGSRCIPFTLMRRRSDAGALAPLSAEMGLVGRYRDELHQAALSSLGWYLLRYERWGVCPFQGRAADLWAPLLAVAEWADEGTGGDAVRGSLMRVASWTLDGCHAERLPEGDMAVLSALRSLVKRGAKPSATGVLELAMRCGGAVVRGWTPRGVAEALLRYGLRASRTSGVRHYSGLSEETFEAIELRWSIEIPPAEPMAEMVQQAY